MAFNLCDLGEIARLQGDYAYYEESLAISQETGFCVVSADCLRGLGNLAEQQGDFAAAKKYFQECLAATGLSGFCPHSPSAMTGLGWVALGLGEEREAKDHFYEALKLEASTQRHSITLDALAGSGEAKMSRESEWSADFLAEVRRRFYLGEPERCILACF